MKKTKITALALVALMGASAALNGMPTAVFAQENIEIGVESSIPEEKTTEENTSDEVIEKDIMVNEIEENLNNTSTEKDSASKAEVKALNEIFVDFQNGSDDTGDGTFDNPIKSLKKAYNDVANQGTIVLKSDLLLNDCIRVQKDVTIKSEGNNKYKITRNDGFISIRDNNRGWYHPAMIEVAGTGSVAFKMENIILDDASKSEGTEYKSQGTVGAGTSGINLQVVHDAMIAIYNPTSQTTLTNVDLLNYAGMTAVKNIEGSLDYQSGHISGGAAQASSRVMSLSSPLATTIGAGVVIDNLNGGTVIEARGNQALTFGGTVLNNNTEHVLQMLDKVNVTLSSSSKISGNTSKFAGIIYARGTGVKLTIDGEISNNRTLKDNSGAIYAYESTVVLENNAKILNNESADPSTLSTQDRLEGKTAGAGIFASEGAKVIMNGGIISGNKSVGGNSLLGNMSGYNGGGGIAVVRNSSFIMNGGKITNNVSNTYGGGILLHVDRQNYSKGRVELNGGEISGNTATNEKVGNDVFLSGFGLNQYHATEIGNYITVNENVVIGDGIANGKTQLYAKELISFGQIKKTTDKVLRDFAAAEGYEPVSSLWVNSDALDSNIMFGIKAPDYDNTVNDLYVAFIPVDKVTGEPVNHEITVQMQKTVENNMVNVSMELATKLGDKTYGVLLMKGARANEAPIINAEDKVFSVGDIFNPLDGVTAQDTEDGEITLTADNIIANDVDMSKVGTYHVTYKVTDNQGASAEKTITVTVNPKMEALNHMPTIIASDKELTVGNAFNPLDGATAQDTEDGEITLTADNVIANDVDMSKAGTYHVTYKVTDSQGAFAEKTITVIVKDGEITVTPSTPQKPNTSNPNGSPQTGDASNLGLLMSMLMGSAGIFAVLNGKRRKRK